MRNIFVQLILNLDQWFRRCYIKIFLIYSSGGGFFFSAKWDHLYNFGRGHYEEHFYEIILIEDQYFSRRCSLKYFLSTALAPRLFREVASFVQFW